MLGEAIIEELQLEHRLRMQAAAFVGWQVHLWAPVFGKKAKKIQKFDKYQKAMGLIEKGQAPQQLSKEEAVRLAELADARARKAFRRRPMQA